MKHEYFIVSPPMPSNRDESTCNAADAHEDEQACDPPVVKRDALRYEPEEFSTTIKIKEVHRIPTTEHPQPHIDYCPYPNKHFFCGVAKKLGCHFCAKPPHG